MVGAPKGHTFAHVLQPMQRSDNSIYHKNGKVVGEAVVGAKVEEYKQHVEDYLNEQK